MTTPHEPGPADDVPRYPPAPPPPPSELAGAGSWPAPAQTPGSSAVPPERPPREILISFWGWVTAAALLVVGAAIDLRRRHDILDALRNANLTQGGHLTDAQLQQAATVTVGVSLAVTVIIGLLYVLFAWKARAGRNWARVVLTIIAVLALLGLVSRGSVSAISYAGEIVAVISAVLLYVPNAGAFFATTGRYRR